MFRPSALPSVIANLRRSWRRSLQLRVVTLTLVSSTIMVMTFGIVVGNMITNGLMKAKITEAQRQVDLGSQAAMDEVGITADVRLEAYNRGFPDTVADLVRGNQENGLAVAVIPKDTSLGVDDIAQPEGFNRYIPETLKAQVHKGGWYYQQTPINAGNGERLYLVFGRSLQASWGQLEIYYFFPLDDQVGAAALVRNTLVATGAALVLLLALVAALVTRMVVNPVRVAARTAQRLSAGLLDQRMEVRGEDDLAALAASFNQMAENLQRHIQRLEEMSRLQRRFTSDVSHELRTPLTTVRMAADLLFTEREGFDPMVARSAELLQTELDRFEILLTDLLEISRFDAGFALLEAEVVDLVPIVRRVVDRLVNLADRVGVQVEVEAPAGPVIAEIDPRRVERVLRNLIGNAVDHSEGRPVRVCVAADEGAAAVTVRDYGVGLKAGEEKLVFNRFWRADPSRARQTGGTGLGLSISLEDARLHGGWLEAWGAPGQGAQFRLTLPIRAGERLVSSPLRMVPADAVGSVMISPRRPVDDLLHSGPLQNGGASPNGGAAPNGGPAQSAGPSSDGDPARSGGPALSDDAVHGGPATPMPDTDVLVEQTAGDGGGQDG